MDLLLRRGAIITVIIALLVPASGIAQQGGAARAKLFKHQTRVLDERAAQQYSGSVRYQPEELFIPGAPSEFRHLARRYKGEFLAPAKAAARRHGVPEELFLALVRQESGWNPRARSVKGALGLAQLMPQTAAVLDVDPLDPLQNLEGGARYLAEQYRRFRSWRLALAAYNAGPEAVEKYGGVPPYRETRNYVKAILGS